MKRPFIYMNYLLKGKKRIRAIAGIDAIPWMNRKGNRFAGRDIETAQAIQARMAQDIRAGRPFMAGRLGAVELAAMRAYEFDDKRIIGKNLTQLCTNAGFFPNDVTLLPRFYEEMAAACRNTDYLAAWFQPFEDYYIRHMFTQDMHMTYLHYIDPFRCPKHPWTEALEGKKVLVVHPQAGLIQSQYDNHRAELFPGTNILPEFTLHTVKAVQTAAGEQDTRYKTWFDALDAMYEQAMQTDFDLAILGCGAYGYPLASYLKNAGKQAVHMGGITQVLFGIHGKRWDEDKNHQFLQKYYSDAWVRVGADGRPSGAKGIEGGCYW
jgi:hypothetical protein